MGVDLAVNLGSSGLTGPVVAQLGYAVLSAVAIPWSEPAFELADETSKFMAVKRRDVR